MIDELVEAWDLEIIERRRDMAITVSTSSGNGTFTPHPEGTFPAVCPDVYDMGMVEVTWQGQTKQQHKIEVYFFCGEWTEPNDAGERFPMLVRQRFTATLDERGRLRPFLEAWRGQKFTADELRGFDVEKLIGAPAFIQVSHAHKGENTYANIDAVMKLPRGTEAPKIPADFKRRHVREAEKAQEGGSQQQQPGKMWEDDESDLPF